LFPRVAAVVALEITFSSSTAAFSLSQGTMDVAMLEPCPHGLRLMLLEHHMAAGYRVPAGRSRRLITIREKHDYTRIGGY
jgi:hypothetical protein